MKNILVNYVHLFSRQADTHAHTQSEYVDKGERTERNSANDAFSGKLQQCQQLT